MNHVVWVVDQDAHLADLALQIVGVLSFGYAHVAAYLSGLDISSFDAKAPPPKTPAFWDIADANRAPEDAEMADAIDKMGNPDAMTLSQIKDAALKPMYRILESWISDRKNRRAIPHRLEKCGYVPVRNDADKKDGQWKIGGSRVTVYARKALSLKERLTAAAALADGLVGENGEVGDSRLSLNPLLPLFCDP